MQPLKSLPIAILLALTFAGCDEARDLDELEALEREHGADVLSDMLEAEDEDDDFDLDLTDDTRPIPDPPTDDIDDVVDVHRVPGPDPEPPEAVPFEKDDQVPIPPANEINDVAAAPPPPDPDAFPIDDLVARHDG